MIGPLCSQFATTLATGCLSHAFRSSIQVFADPLPPSNTVTGESPGQVAGGEHCGGPPASLQYTVSLVQWVNHLFPGKGGCGLRLGDLPTLTMEPGSPVSDVSLKSHSKRFANFSLIH
jgi:hypothetical protein